MSPFAGTTRDVLEVPLDIGGFPVVVSDTAGLNASTSDPIEKQGIERARKRFYFKRSLILIRRFMDAHLRLCVFDATQSIDDNQNTIELLRSMSDLSSIIVALNKATSPFCKDGLLPSDR